MDARQVARVLKTPVTLLILVALVYFAARWGWDKAREPIPPRPPEPCVVKDNETTDPNMATSGSMIGSHVAWADGYTGAGSKVAIIDTGAAVARQLQRLLGNNGLLAAGPAQATRFWTSADPSSLKKILPVLWHKSDDVQSFAM